MFDDTKSDKLVRLFIRTMLIFNLIMVCVFAVNTRINYTNDIRIDDAIASNPIEEFNIKSLNEINEDYEIFEKSTDNNIDNDGKLISIKDYKKGTNILISYDEINKDKVDEEVERYNKLEHGERYIKDVQDKFKKQMFYYILSITFTIIMLLASWYIIK